MNFLFGLREPFPKASEACQQSQQSRERKAEKNFPEDCRIKISQTIYKGENSALCDNLDDNYKKLLNDYGYKTKDGSRQKPFQKWITGGETPTTEISWNNEKELSRDEFA